MLNSYLLGGCRQFSGDSKENVEGTMKYSETKVQCRERRETLSSDPTAPCSVVVVVVNDDAIVFV